MHWCMNVHRRGGCGVVVIIIENEHETQVQILHEAVCISHITITPLKGMNRTFLCAALGK